MPGCVQDDPNEEDEDGENAVVHNWFSDWSDYGSNGKILQK